MRPQKKNVVLASTVAAVLATLGPLAAHAVTLPATTFTNNVVAGGTSICPAGVNALTDGICTYTSPSSTSAGFAHTDGGIAGTPGFDPLASPGTHVSSGATGPGVSSFATMTYYFLVGGPTVPGGQQIAVDILSSGASFLSGGTGFSYASLLITDAGSDAGIPGGAPDPDYGFVVDSRYSSVSCLFGRCSTSGAAWAQADQFGSDHLCLTQGDMYAITITAATTVYGGSATGSAFVDPKIIVDPQGPTDPKASCYQPADPSLYTVSISNGASTGVTVTEPGTLGLLGLGLFGIGLRRGFGRRSRERA